MYMHLNFVQPPPPCVCPGNIMRLSRVSAFDQQFLSWTCSSVNGKIMTYYCFVCTLYHTIMILASPCIIQ